MSLTDNDDFLDELLEDSQFKNNPNLLQIGAKVPRTLEQMLELNKCEEDPIYFIKNYIKVIHPDKGLVLMDLYEYQERMIRAYHENKRVIFLTARQQGKTTVSAAYFVWYILFNKAKSVAILANKQATADEIMDRVRLAYENLPKWMQQGVQTWNKRTIVLENGSKCFGAATSKSGTRGKTVNLLYLDEFAFVENNQANEFFTAVYPTITAGRESKVFMTSTPNGFNHFYKFWNEADPERGKGWNGFHRLRVHWYETPGRDQTWYETQKAVLGELKAAQELDAEFLGSSLQLLSAATMSRLSYENPIREYKDKYKGLKIYSDPAKDRNYVMTVDVSRGRHLDSHAFWVVDVSAQPYKIVATYNNNETSPLMYATIIYQICKNYNEAYVLVEINDVGSEVANALYYEWEYENMFWTKAGDLLGKRGADPYPGIRTTKKTKRIGCANLKDLIEKEALMVNDFQTITELSTFVQSQSGSYEADEGFHDDMVMCGVLFAWLQSQPWFKDLTDRDMRSEMYSDAIRQAEEDLLPSFGYSNGQENEFGGTEYDVEAMRLLLN